MSCVRIGISGVAAFHINYIRLDAGWDYASLMTVLQQVAVTVAEGCSNR
jgi:hypothetical protein